MTPVRDFAGIYEQHVSKVFGFFAYVLSSRDDAEDLTQQTFERALRAWDRYDESRGSGSAWLMAIARNLFLDNLRSGRAIRTESVEETGLDELAAAPDRLSLGLDPDLERALGELGPRERELVALRFGADLSAGQIAELVGLSVANVHQILSRALRRMRGSLDRIPAAAGRRAEAG